MTTLAFKIEFDDSDILCLEKVLKEDIEKTFRENPKYKEMSEGGAHLRSEIVLKKIKDSVSKTIKKLLDEKNQNR